MAKNIILTSLRQIWWLIVICSPTILENLTILELHLRPGRGFNSRPVKPIFLAVCGQQTNNWPSMQSLLAKRLVLCICYCCILVQCVYFSAMSLVKVDSNWRLRVSHLYLKDRVVCNRIYWFRSTSKSLKACLDGKMVSSLNMHC